MLKKCRLPQTHALLPFLSANLVIGLLLLLGCSQQEQPQGNGGGSEAFFLVDAAETQYVYEYVVSPTAVNQANAELVCNAKGGWLATIRSAEDTAKLRAQYGATPAWSLLILGGSDSGSEGTWWWKYGPPEIKNTFVSFAGGWDPWLAGEPNNGGGGPVDNQLCLWNHGVGDYLWTDYSDTVLYQDVLCQFISTPTPTASHVPSSSDSRTAPTFTTTGSSTKSATFSPTETQAPTETQTRSSTGSFTPSRPTLSSSAGTATLSPTATADRTLSETRTQVRTPSGTPVASSTVPPNATTSTLSTTASAPTGVTATRTATQSSGLRNPPEGATSSETSETSGASPSFSTMLPSSGSGTTAVLSTSSAAQTTIAASSDASKGDVSSWGPVSSSSSPQSSANSSSASRTSLAVDSGSHDSSDPNSGDSGTSSAVALKSPVTSASLYAWIEGPNVASSPDAVATKDAARAITVTAIFVNVAAALDAQSLGTIGLLSCAQPINHLSLQNYQLLSPLATSDTYEGKIAGNLIIAVVLCTLHLVVVCVLKKIQNLETWSEAQAAGRWPSFSWYFLFLLYQGTAAAGIKTLQASDASVGSLMLGSLAIILTIPLLPLATAIVVFWKVTSTFHRYEYPGSGEVTVERFVPLFDPTTVGLAPAEEEEVSSPPSAHPGSSILQNRTALGEPGSQSSTSARSIYVVDVSTTGPGVPPPGLDVPSFPRWASLSFLPRGKWMPQQMRQRYGSFYGELGRYEKLWCTLPMWSPSIIVLAVAIRPTTPDGCTGLFSALASLEFVISALLLAFRPLRSALANSLTASCSICLGVVFIGLALQTQNPNSATAFSLTLRGVQALMAVTCLRVVWTVVQFTLERVVLCRVPLAPQIPMGVWIGRQEVGSVGSRQEDDPESGLELGLLSTPAIATDERTEESTHHPSSRGPLGEDSKSEETSSSLGSFDDDLL